MTNRELKKARQEFLDEMISFYSQDPVGRRSIGVDNNCYYRHPYEDRKCSIGRYIPDDKYDKNIEGKNVTVLMNSYNGRATFPNVLPMEIQNLGAYFLRQVQSIHDSNESWNNRGLINEGLSRKNYIENNYINNLPDDDNEVQG